MAESTYTAMAVGDGYPVPPLPNPGEGGPVPDFDFPPEPGPGPELDNGNVPVIPLPNPGEGGPLPSFPNHNNTGGITGGILGSIITVIPRPIIHATSAILPSMALSAS